jgi:AraC-like DNA-binding protein
VNNAAFRKVLDWDGETVALFTNRVSFFNPETLSESKVLLSGKEFTDMELTGDTLLCADTSGALYRLTKNGWSDTLHVPGCIYDIGKEGDQLLLAGASGIFRYSSGSMISNLVNGVPAIQTAATARYIFFTNYEGLYLLMNDTVFTIVKNIEFNKKALSIHNNLLYAGSIDGLYTIQLNSFQSNMLPGLKPVKIKVTDHETAYWKWAIGVLLVILIALAWLVIFRKRTAELVIQPVKAPVISPEALRDLIRAHPELITVQALADKLNTSVVQLNRKLKKYNDTPLNLMQDVKREIAKEMQAGGYTMDEIARRTGYSKRYIRENFLNTKNDV